VPDFEIESFGSAVLATIIVAVTNWLLTLLFGRPERGRRERR
jgi:uncharacterized membrane protein YvlD (DUF360 family)